MSVWSGVLDSCPGLLCCVINIKGRLIYATHGYKAIAARIFGHKCEEGRNYPPLITDVDRAIHEALTAACLGESNAVEIDEGANLWELTASPLRLIEDGEPKISGVVMRIASASSVRPQPQPQIIRSDPNLLEAVPFRACVVGDDGEVLAANKFLCESLGLNPSGSNITKILEPESHSEVMQTVANRSGCADVIMQDISEHENFYTFTPEEVYLDGALNKLPEREQNSARHMRIHSGPIDWNGTQASLLTFEDITETSRNREQLRRLLTFDTHTGILNRRGLEHVLLRRISHAVKKGEYLSLISISIDSHKYITETMGYVAGERMVRDFVRNMTTFLKERAGSVAARWGRDEFMIASECSGAVAVIIANEIRERSEKVPVSAGVADFSDGLYSGVTDFIAAAYDTMNRAKSEGGNITLLAGKR